MFQTSAFVINEYLEGATVPATVAGLIPAGDCYHNHIQDQYHNLSFTIDDVLAWSVTLIYRYVMLI